MDKPTPRALEAFDAAFPDDPRAVRKQMFGMPAGFVNGNMFLGVFADGVVLRLGEADLGELSALEGMGPFEPMPGRRWKEYLHADSGAWGGSEELAGWARAALDYTEGLPPKKKK